MRYIVKFKSTSDKKEFDRKYNYETTQMSRTNDIFFINCEGNFLNELSNYTSVIEPRPVGVPSWRPINTSYRRIAGGSYDEYVGYYFESGFAISDVTDWAPNKVIGPWYIMTGYLGLLHAWNVAQGSGATVTCQEKFDYTNIAYRVTGTNFGTSQYRTIYATITGGTHEVFAPYTTGGNIFPTISSLSNVCYFYSGGTDYSCDGSTSGCVLGNPPNLTNSWYNPTLCYASFYGPWPMRCQNGQWAWNTGTIPSSYAPFGHGDIITSIIGARNTPISNITGYGQQTSNVGIAPQCKILIGSNEDTYLERETELGAQIRVGAYTNAWSQLEADVAYSGGTILIRGPGVLSNFNASVENIVKPINTIQFAPARYLGNEDHIYNATGLDVTTTGNYGMYAGYGRSDYVDFAAPAILTWAAHPRYNHNNWGEWCGSFSGNSISAAIGGGLFALVKSVNSGWSFEDLTTALYQSCRPYEYRTVPEDQTFCGMTVLNQALAATGYVLHMSGNQGGLTSVNWAYAYPSGDSFMADHQNFSIVQFGASPSDPLYELIAYSGVSSSDNIVSGKETAYGSGTIHAVYRGYGGTIPKAHTLGEKIYTPMIRSNIWTEYLGWGMPDMRKAVSLSKESLSIMPPQKVTVSSYSNNDTYKQYWDNYNKFEINPFLSSNYGGIAIVKNPYWYPDSIYDGEICFSSKEKVTEIIGYDLSIVPTDMYYSVFQFTNNNTPQYSTLAKYSTVFSQNSNIWNLTPYENKNGTDLTINISRLPNIEYAKISGYNLKIDIYDSGSVYKYTDYKFGIDGITVTGLVNGDIIIASSFAVPASSNLIGVSSYDTWDMQNWGQYVNCGANRYSTTPYHDAYYDKWSYCLTITGNIAGEIGVSGSQFSAIYESGYTTTIYSKILSGSGLLNVYYDCYQNPSAYLGSITVISTGATSDWEIYSGYETITYANTDYVKMRASLSAPSSTGYNSILISNIQVVSGDQDIQYNKYRPFTSNTEGIISGSITYHFGDINEPDNVSCYLFNNNVTVSISGFPDWLSDNVKVYNNSSSLIGSVSTSGGRIITSEIPSFIEVANITYKNINIYDFRIPSGMFTCVASSYSYGPEQELDRVPSFEYLVDSGLDLSFGANPVPTGLLPMYNLYVPVEISRENSDISSYISIYGKEPSGDPFHIATINDNCYVYIRKPEQTEFSIQAITTYGLKIESNIIIYSG